VEVKNNPAGRLHDLLERARVQSGKTSTREAWAAVFEVSSKDTGTLLKMLADLIDLSHETKAAIQRLTDVDHEIYLRPFKKIETVFAHINFEAAWDSQKGQLDDQTLYGLTFAADKLKRASGYTKIEEDELSSLRAALEEVLNDVVNADLPQALKQLFVRNIEALRHALLAYKIRGIEGLEEEIERVVGSIVLRRNEVAAAVPASANKKVWENFFTVVDRINKAVSLAKNVEPLVAPAIPMVMELLKLAGK
jgi:hypothetical protein